MNNYIAFLRAINVAGHCRVKMIDLKQAFSAAGCKNVKTYIQSGNAIFKTPHEDIEIIKLAPGCVRALAGQDPRRRKLAADTRSVCVLFDRESA